MKLIKTTTWDQVFQDWQTREGTNPDWIKCATAVKGWPDWKSWRGFTAQQLRAPEREWRIYKFTNPLTEIPEMLVGPSRSWQTGLMEKNTTTFTQLLTQPRFLSNKNVLKLMAALPFTTQFIGLKRQDLNKIVCLDGHHRAAAVALAQRQNQKIDFNPVEITIALTEVPADESRVLIDHVLARGSSKNP